MRKQKKHLRPLSRRLLLFGGRIFENVRGVLLTGGMLASLWGLCWAANWLLCKG